MINPKKGMVGYFRGLRHVSDGLCNEKQWTCVGLRRWSGRMLRDQLKYIELVWWCLESGAKELQAIPNPFNKWNSLKLPHEVPDNTQHSLKTVFLSCSFGLSSVVATEMCHRPADFLWEEVSSFQMGRLWVRSQTKELPNERCFKILLTLLGYHLSLFVVSCGSLKLGFWTSSRMLVSR